MGENKLIVQSPPQTESTLADTKLDSKYGPHPFNSNWIIDPTYIYTLGS